LSDDWWRKKFIELRIRLKINQPTHAKRSFSCLFINLKITFEFSSYKSVCLSKVNCVKNSYVPMLHDNDDYHNVDLFFCFFARLYFCVSIQ